MTRRVWCWLLLLLLAVLFFPSATRAQEPIKVGILGMDNYQGLAFTEIWHRPDVAGDLAGLKVVAVVPGQPSPRIADSEKLAKQWLEQIARFGPQVVGSVEELLPLVDAVILMSLDGSQHLDQVRPVLKAGKPVYIGRPMAASLVDVLRIFRLAEEAKCPIFSCSQHRFSPGFFDMRNHPEIGKVTGCCVYGGYPKEQPRDDEIWGALHGVETLCTIMQSGCQSVTRTSTPDAELLACVWSDGRIGSWRGLKQGAVKYQALVFGEKGISPSGVYGYAAPINGQVPAGKYMGYEGVAIQIARFFKTRQPPVSEAETLEVFALLEAAEESQRQGGKPVKLADILQTAREQAQSRP